MTVNRSSSIINEVQSNVVKIPGTEQEVLVDGDFANWEMNYIPDGYGMIGLTDGSPTDYSYMTRSSDPNAGTYAMELDNDAGGESAVIEVPLNTWAVDGQTLQARLYGKSANSAGIGISYGYYNDADDDLWYYNFTGAGAGTWTVNDGNGTPNSDQIETWSPTSSYTQNTFTQVTLPGADVLEGTMYISSSGVSGVALIDDIECLVAAVDQAADGNMESWTEWADQTSPLDEWDFQAGVGWEFFPDATDNATSYINRSADAQAGSYSTTMYLGTSMEVQGDNARGYVYQTYTGSVGANITASVYTKTTNSKTGYMILLDGTPGAHTQIWDFVGSQWITAGATVTDLPGTGNALTCSGTTSYVENTDDLTIPATGKVVMVLMSDKGDGFDQHVFYFDTASLTTVTGGNQVQVFQNRNEGTTLTDLEATDRIIEWTFKNGDVGLALGGKGKFETDLSTLSFSGIDLRIDDAVELDNPATKSDVVNISNSAVRLGGVGLLGGTAAIDFTTTGQTLTFIVPDGHKFIAHSYMVEIIDSDAPNGDAIISIGTAGGGYNDVANIPGGIVTDGHTGTVAATAILGAGDQIYINVGTADTGTTLTGKVHLFGTMFAI